MERCNKYSKQNTKLHYDFLAPNYEGIYNAAGYPDPKQVSKLVAAHTKGSNKDQVKILDMACGTGLVGKYLAQEGFRSVEGVDISTVMLQEAADKSCYSRLEEHDIDDIEEFPSRLKNRFDVVTCAGVVNNNHMDYKLFEEMVMAAKKGGLLVFAARYSFMGSYWYESVLEKMEEENRIKLVATEEFFKYDKLTAGVGRFSKTPCRAYVYKCMQEELTTYKKDDQVDKMGFFSACNQD